MTGSGGWAWERLSYLVPDNVLVHIASLLPPSAEAGPDRLAWKWRIKDNFSNSKTYRNLHHFEGCKSSKIWNLVWKSKAPQRVQVFVWLLWQNRLMTNEERVRRHMSNVIASGAAMFWNRVRMPFGIVLLPKQFGGK